MSEPTGPANANVVAYLQQQLALNPWDASDQIVATRARALRLKQKPTAQPTDDTAERRQEIRDTLEAIRDAAFTADATKLQEKLSTLEVDDFPDLHAAADRLRVILAARCNLPALTQHRDFNAHFFDCFKQVLVAPARDTAVLRERVMASFRTRKLRRTGKKMIALLERETPELCELERTWLDSLTNQKPQVVLSGGPSLSTGEAQRSSMSGSTKTVLLVLFFVASAIIRAGLRSQDGTVPPSVTAPGGIARPLTSHTEPQDALRQRAKQEEDALFDRAEQPLRERSYHAQSDPHSISPLETLPPEKDWLLTDPDAMTNELEEASGLGRIHFEPPEENSMLSLEELQDEFARDMALPEYRESADARRRRIRRFQDDARRLLKKTPETAPHDRDVRSRPSFERSISGGFAEPRFAPHEGQHRGREAESFEEELSRIRAWQRGVSEKTRRKKEATAQGKSWSKAGSSRMHHSRDKWTFEFGPTPKQSYIRGDVEPLTESVSFEFTDASPDIDRQLQELTNRSIHAHSPLERGMSDQTPEELRLEAIQRVRKLHNQHTKQDAAPVENPFAVPADEDPFAVPADEDPFSASPAENPFR